MNERAKDQLMQIRQRLAKWMAANGDCDRTGYGRRAMRELAELQRHVNGLPAKRSSKIASK